MGSKNRAKKNGFGNEQARQGRCQWELRVEYELGYYGHAVRNSQWI